MKRLAFLAAFLFALSVPALAQSPEEITPEYVETLERQVGAVEAQNEILREQSDSLVSTVRWTVGAIVAILGISVGVNYLQTKRRTDTLLSELESEINARIKEAVREINDENKRFKSSLVNEFTKSIDRLEKDIKYVEFDIKRRIAEKSISEDDSEYQGLNLNKLAEVISIANEEEITSHFDSIVERLLYSLQNAKFIYSDTAGRLMEVLDMIPDKYKADKERIEELIREKRTAS